MGFNILVLPVLLCGSLSAAHLRVQQRTSTKNAVEAEPNCSKGFDAPYGTSCPHATWVDRMVQADPSPQKVIMSIGCNIGDDLITWMERWDRSQSWSVNQWQEFLKDDYPTAKWHACKPYPFQRAFATKARSASANTRGAPTGVCVEPMQNNVEMLEKAAENLGYGTNSKSGSFSIVQAAVMDKASPKQTVNFPDGKHGTANEGLKQQLLIQTPVPVKTVDGIVAELKLPKVDILLVDVEGWDPAVLKGAASTLASVRYLEFEVHRDLKNVPWSHTTLRSVVDELDRQGFDCYWTGNNGKLLSMSACWSDAFERGAWSNAACIKRDDPWHIIFES